LTTKFFSPEELVEINALPLRSKEQIDKMIVLYDKYGACDDLMRKKIYTAFQVPA